MSGQTRNEKREAQAITMTENKSNTGDNEQRQPIVSLDSRFAFLVSRFAPVSAAILAGGTSSRMGTNKALLRLTPESPTLIETVIECLAQAGFPAPLVIANSPADYAFLDLPTLPDDIPEAGPLGGILTALRHAPHDRVLMVACDMPFLNPTLLRHMADLPPEYEALAPAWTDLSGKRLVEPLHAIYSKGAIPTIERRIAVGQLKLHDLLDSLHTVYLPEKETRQRDPQCLSFRNVNTPEDWARLLAGDQE